MLSFLLPFLFSATPSLFTLPIAHAAPVELTSTTSIAAFVRKIQHEYKLGDDFYDTLAYESWGFQNIQSRVPSKKGPNGKENSWGVCQIHLSHNAHPEVTMEQAMSPEWCVRWSAERFRQGFAREWTGWHVVTSRKASTTRASSSQ